MEMRVGRWKKEKITPSTASLMPEVHSLDFKKVKMKHRDKILFIDTETGGLDPKNHSLLSVGLVLWRECKIFDIQEVFVNDGKLNATREALEINGIDLDQHRKTSVAPGKAIRQMIQFMKRNFDTSELITLAGHNVGFDISFVRFLFESQNYRFADYFSHRSIDTSSILHYLYFTGKLESKIVSSTDAFKHFGIEVAGRHTALGDAIATAELFTKLIELTN
jgi:DNA polymerase-3 subunit epsilon